MSKKKTKVSSILEVRFPMDKQVDMSEEELKKAIDENLNCYDEFNDFLDNNVDNVDGVKPHTILYFNDEDEYNTLYQIFKDDVIQKTTKKMMKDIKPRKLSEFINRILAQEITLMLLLTR